MDEFFPAKEYIRKALFVVVYCLSFGDLEAQALVKINCLVPYEVQISGTEFSTKDGVEIRYVDHDDHTFWYKLIVQENSKLAYQFSSLDNLENFDIYFYQYSGNNFCRAFIQENLEMISFEQNVATRVSKGEVYYLGIYPLQERGCGHSIQFKFGDRNFELKALNERVKCSGNSKIENPVSTADENIIEVKGLVRDKKSGNKINATIKLFDPFTNHEVEIFSNDTEGFVAKLYSNGDYKIHIKSFGYVDKISALPAYADEMYKFDLLESKENRHVLDRVYFYPNTYALKEESMPELEGVYSFMKIHPKSRLEIIGHTNGNKDVKASRIMEKNGPEWNFTGSAKELSFKRATVIKNFLKDKGIDPNLINAKGVGGDQMLVQDPENMREAMKNIRVEMVITN